MMKTASILCFLSDFSFGLDLDRYYDISTVEDLQREFELEGLGLVLKHSFSEDQKSEDGNSPLHIMLEHWEDVQPEAVEMLIKEKNLDVNGVNSFGETALHGALLCYRDDSDDDYRKNWLKMLKKRFKFQIFS